MKPTTHMNHASLLAAASLIAMVPATAFAQQSSTTQGADAAPPVGQAASPSAVGAEAAGQPEEVVVTGIRGAQTAAVNVKRNAASVVDAISAEDIGKLPDITISDSLQRIPGVQIRREAGEGGAVNVRGLPQVVTLLNGESYLGANSITTIQPNFTDIPSQLFAGADVIKSTTADLLNAGITGTINLRTRRPFDLKRGLTAAATAEVGYGDRTKKYDPQGNILLGYHGEGFGALVSATYADVNLANSHNGIQEGYGGTLHNESLADATSSGGFSPANRPHGTAVAGGIDVNGDGDANDTFWVPQSQTAWKREVERKRLGINGSVQADLSDALQFVADGFYTRQLQYDRIAGFQFQDVNWQAAEFVPGVSRKTDVKLGSYDFNTIQRYDYDLPNFDSYSETFRTLSSSKNFNAELKFDNGGKFKMTVRGIYGKAKQKRDESYTQFSLSNGFQWQANGIGHYPASLGGNRVFNSNGYAVDTIAGPGSLHAVVDYSGGTPTFTLPSQLTSEIGSMDNYALKTISSEGNYRRSADLKVGRADGSYEFSDALNLSFGARYSKRNASNTTFDRVSPFYAGSGASNPAGCLVKWKAFDVNLNNTSTCTAGDAGGYFTAGLTRKANDPIFAGMVKQFTLPVNGVPALYVLDPKAQDHAEDWQNKFYPGSVDSVQPGASYKVGVEQKSGYIQANFNTDVGIPFSGNFGLRVIQTKLHIVQNLTDPNPQAYGVSALDAGDVVTNRSFTDVLPAINVAFDFTRRLKLRAAYSKTMTLLNLDQWGGGLTLNYAIDTSSPGTPVFAVRGGNSDGNPFLDPWRADNYDLSLEYYIGRSSLVNVGFFYIDVASFIERGSVTRTDLPDNDGVVRNRSVQISTPIQGNGGKLKGFELGAKLAFNDVGLGGFLSDFGVDANLTYSPSKGSGDDLVGHSLPFQDNSKIQTNVALWYQGDKLQARVAHNFRSKRLENGNFSDLGGGNYLQLWQKPTNYVDASVSYDFTPNVTVYVQGSNLTGERERYYLTFKDLKAYNNIYERRFLAGARVKF
ncbi:TonB-dependent receptor [Sphingomonas crusticola]|uniref:TonB-dependent receptor n=1 Tax=Sphingomonas crusticola TaxID=1697973 RepID=UPI001F0836DE|nr:TonB-dependent receptor [Sphingomonas crusticola]